MLLEPASVEDLQRQLADASARRSQIAGANLGALNRIIEYAPEDMVVTVQTGMTLATLQKELLKHNQWLPIDPPKIAATLEEIISLNLSGSRRLGFGTIRDHLLGLTVVIADGTRISSGGKVVKNVAGFDLQKLFVGARGTLGIPVEASFKLLPRPELELFAHAVFDTLLTARLAIERLSEKGLWPIGLDLYQLESSGPILLLVGFAGTHEDVQQQLESAAEIGLNGIGSIEEQLSFWNSGEALQKQSLLPSKLFEAIEKIKPKTFLARAGNGILYYRGGIEYPMEMPTPQLMARLKQAYDPKSVFAPFAP